MGDARRHGSAAFSAPTRCLVRGIALSLTLWTLAQVWPDSWCLADDEMQAPVEAEEERIIEVESIGRWLRAPFSPDELTQLQAGAIKVGGHYCGCYDQPTRQYPYSIVVIATPRGDLITRPEGVETSVRFTLLAVRHGERYCDVESEHCFGSFPDICSFTDYRYGPYLAQYFPTCKMDDDEQTVMTHGR